MLWVYKRRIPTKCSDVRDFIIVLKWIHKHFCELKEKTRKIGALLIGGALTIRVNFNHFFLSLELALDRFGSTSLRRLMVSNNRTRFTLVDPCKKYTLLAFSLCNSFDKSILYVYRIQYFCGFYLRFYIIFNHQHIIQFHQHTDTHYIFGCHYIFVMQ